MMEAKKENVEGSQAMDKRLMATIESLVERYAPEGFLVLGVFGSRARGDHHSESDLDLLYRLEDTFYDRHVGWEAVGRVEEIRAELKKSTGFEVDLANINSLRDAGRKYILPETVYLAKS